MLRVAFAGTPDFAARVLEGIAASGHEVALVISQPDRARGRGRKTFPTPVAALARELDLPLLQPERISDADERIARCDVLVVAAYGQILRAGTLYAARLDAFNVHASLLPKYRGAAPVERAIMAGETETGVSIMKMDEGLDTGDIALTRSFPIGENTTGGELTRSLAWLGAEAVVEVLDLLEKGEVTLKQQNNLQATYAAKITPEDQELDWRRPAREVHDRVRALSPHIGARTRAEGFEGPVKIWTTRVEAEDDDRLEPGRVHAASGEILVGCGKGRLRVLELQAPGARRMEAAEFLRGRELDGALLFPAKLLE
ncbi:fmt: methionyl-tRNA formyltransferase [Rubrobacter radiotolerans]|uniref:Methionyl-tRNA formyltransferase n=1 Tax=Rubrobacter radiotolerans TaxID=42256 RepID=A0A023X2R9_RUBRA|nr:methionyl-tRNA formyltransferase [Rubrobacter radiotolerans]AHY46757.1 fmt: methionyl-tRNA formyltransferase [Rubrobacter radiotolerans]MDX5894164.1 methionyl-tRNA formyltransferase [Rubrobacter radiotolerans]SMC05352.1 methionyl-tRNA formyltransferase [Rubrobacter radiotolerans DSM 5868]